MKEIALKPRLAAPPVDSSEGGGRSDIRSRIARVRRLAWVVDAVGRVPGTRFRFGLNSIIGLAPAAGDAVLVLISLYIVYEAKQLGLPRQKIKKMVSNVVIEAALGALPVVGDLLDVAWKANLRNVAIIEEHFAGEGRGR